jgi:hypothetical protein
MTSSAEKQRRWRAANPERASELNRNWQRRIRFGVSPEEFALMVDSQDDLCAICGKPETQRQGGRLRALNIDHDRRCCPGNRSCGKCIRGLLCSRCNVGIGMLGEDPAVLARAIEYLTKRNHDED